jgi:hypothetical protein
MKSGRKIYLTLLASEDVPRAVHQLRNGDLRSLLKRLKNPHGEPPCEKRDLIYGLAMIEGADRFADAKGQKIL